MTATRILYFLLILKAVALATLMLFGSLHLAPDEAQYWTWSRDLSLGYYSKPPAISWQIYLTTFLLGQNEFGIRAGALVLGFLMPLAIYYLAPVTRPLAFASALALAFSPLGIFLSFAATTDAGAIFFLLVAVLIVATTMDREKGPHYVLAGFSILLGALYKWTAFVFWPLLGIFLLFYPSLRRKSLFLGIAISLLAFIPTLVWNYTHDFATFKHVFGQIFHGASGEGGVKAKGNFIDFLGAQMGLLSPIYFVGLIWGLWRVYTRRPSREFLFIALFPLMLFGYFFASVFTKIQPNWAAYLLPPGFILIAWIYSTSERIVWLLIGGITSVLFVAGAIFIPTIQSNSLFLPCEIPYKASPFRQNVGWDAIAPALVEAGYDSSSQVLFADKYQTASLLSFYGPDKKRAYFFNLNQQRKNQFSYWPPMQKNANGFFAIIENTNESTLKWYEEHYKEKLAPYFSSVEFVKATPLFKAYNVSMKYMLLFKCTEFTGQMPQDPEKY